MDYQEVATLLQIEEKTREQPKMKNIHREALEQLAVINSSLEETPKVQAVVSKPAKVKPVEKEDEHIERRA